MCIVILSNTGIIGIIKDKWSAIITGKLDMYKNNDRMLSSCNHGN